jgi:phosphopantetheine--protein transferase-like protein
MGIARHVTNAISLFQHQVSDALARPGGHVLRGIGVDVAQVSRVGALYRRFGDRFLRKAFHADEIQEFERLWPGDACPSGAAPCPEPVAPGDADWARFLASRWAAKEALHKALGDARFEFPLVQVCKHQRVSDSVDARGSGPPFFRFHGAAARLLTLGTHGDTPHGDTPNEGSGGRTGRALLSLSHDGDVCVALVAVVDPVGPVAAVGH